jgi:hypothetical protein
MAQPVVLRHNFIRHDNHEAARSAPPGSREAARFRKQRGRAMGSIRYYQMRERSAAEPPRQIFTKDGTVSRERANRMMDECQGRHFIVHRMALSPGEGRDGEDLRELTRHVMRELQDSKRQELHWVAVEHHNTDHAHVHIVIFGGGREMDPGGEYSGSNKAVRIGTADHDLIKRETEEYCRSRERERASWMRALDRANGERARDARDDPDDYIR